MKTEEEEKVVVDDKLSGSSNSSTTSEKKKRKKKKKKKSKGVKGGEIKFDYMATLTEEQQEIFKEFKQRFEPTNKGSSEVAGSEQNIDEEYKNEFTDRQLAYLTPFTFLRYLRAREWDQDAAEKLLRGTLDWLEEFRPDEITFEDVESEVAQEKMYVFPGFDKFQRPIIYMKPRNDTGTDRELKLKYLVYVLEQAIAKLNPNENGVDKLCLMIDFGGTGMKQSSVSNIQVSLDCLKVLQDHYPERLGVAFMMNTPWVFGMFWKCITPFLPEETLKKIIFVEKNLDLIQETIDKQNIEKDYGGDSDYKFSFEEEKERQQQKK